MPRRETDIFSHIANFQALTAAALNAARGKRRKPGVAAFLAGLEHRVLRLGQTLLDGTWQPGEYTVIQVLDVSRVNARGGIHESVRGCVAGSR